MICAALPVSVMAQHCDEDSRKALAWLDKTSRAWDELSYRGVVSIQRGDDIQVIEVAHRAGGQTSNELISALTDRGGSAQSIEHSVKGMHPGQQLLRYGAQAEGGAGGCGVARYYSLSLSEGQPVAGQDTVHLYLKPRDVYRYGYLMALDKHTGLLLKAQIISPQGKTLERFQFARIEYSAPLAGIEVEVPTAAQVAADEVVGMPVVPVWAPKWLPEGFVLTDTRNPLQRLTYTDGLSVFSVFRELVDEPIVAGEGVVRLGGTVSYTRGVMHANQAVLVTVVGDVPVNTARMVADAVLRP